MNPVDKAFERSKLGTIREGSIHIVRYADDMLILAMKNLSKGIHLLKYYIDRLGLKINEEKTRSLSLKKDKKVEFLGFEFHKVVNKLNKKRLILVSPSPKSQKGCREKIRKLVNHSNPLKVKDQVENLNKYLTGWTGYYRLGNSGKALMGICNYTNKRVRRLMQRHKDNGGYGWKGITSEQIYGKLGLFYNYKVHWL